ncbi:radial spoke head 14 homolog isoform X1 [Macrotis lagotis]|uniref:radial spoke head 14 homolog isoform X1 n=1 Tax=Macrotis lagotis TaxID=92651 RepID=UPI003D692E62
MAHPQISQCLPPDIDPTKAPIAYGRRALPKLNEELQSEDLLTRQRALMALCDLVHDPEHVYEAISLEMLMSLKLLLKDPDDTVRQKTTEVFYIMANHSVGREGFIKHNVIIALFKILDDPDLTCRTFLHLTYRSLAQVPTGSFLRSKEAGMDPCYLLGDPGEVRGSLVLSPLQAGAGPQGFEGAEAILKNGLIPHLVKKLPTEVEDIQELILDTLYFCIQLDATQALQAKGVPILRENLNSPNKNIRSKAAHALIAICIPQEGKNLVEDHDVIEVLVKLLENSSNEVKGNAAGALMFATVTTEGKYAALNAGAIPHLLELLDIQEVKVLINAIKALTMLAEAPEGRRELLPEVYRFKILIKHPNQVVARTARIAVKVIEWKP